MAIAPIGGVPGVATTIAPAGSTGASQSSGSSFAAGLEAVSKAAAHADALGTQVATGQLQDVHQFMAAATKANLAVELTVAIRNKAVEAYQEIMRMQI